MDQALTEVRLEAPHAVTDRTLGQTQFGGCTRETQMASHGFEGDQFGERRQRAHRRHCARMTAVHARPTNRHLPGAGSVGTLRAMNPLLDLASDSQGATSRTVRLTINGITATHSVPAHATLATLLRDRLGLTGTKIACDQAACGACTVL